MEEKPHNEEETKYSLPNSKPVSLLIFGVLSLIFFVCFVVFISIANAYPFTSNGREATRAIMNFASIMFFVFSLLSGLAIIFRKKKPYFIATKHSKKFNIIEQQTDDDNETRVVDNYEIKSKHNLSSLSELNEYLKSYASSYRTKSETLAPMLASVFYSRLSIIKTTDHKFVEIFASFFSNDSYWIDYLEKSEEESVTTNSSFIEACHNAELYADIPSFFIISHAKLKEMGGYLSPVKKAISNPNDKFTFFCNGDDIVLPKNLNFVLVVDEGEEVFDVDKSLLEYASYFEPVIEECEQTDSCLPANVTYSLLKSWLKDAKQNYSINEDSWKRTDAVIDAASSHTNYVINNKSYLKIENFCLSLFVFIDDEFKAIDETLADVVLISTLSHWEEETFKENATIERTFTNNLGSKAPKTMKRWKSFRKLFDEKGKRL